ncbi:hypothetical protein ScPMuIL_014011 [Solemya velum]
MAYHCAVSGCSNGSYRLLRWEKERCQQCQLPRGKAGSCTCDPPFKLHPFPTSRKNRELRQQWKVLINRTSAKSRGKLWSPSKDSRVCSDHFVDGAPTAENTFPTLNLGYVDANKKYTRRWRGVSAISNKIRKFTRKPKRFGPNRRIQSTDEFLLTLMRLRLGLLNFDLAKRFTISESLASQIFQSWLKAMANVLGKMVYIPDQESLIATKPDRYRHLPGLHSILDCSEVFIETPKDLYLQSATWSDYKHHNTLKFLVCVAPNSSIIFVYKANMGRISDKALTMDCGYLDKVPQYFLLMADKGFNLETECVARSLTLYVPPGKRGLSQMTPDAVRKTKKLQIYAY